MSNNYPKNRDSTDAEIGFRIRARRKYLSLTQKDLACNTGVTSQQIQKYETGINKISIPMLLKICKALSVDPDYFFSSDSSFEEELCESETGMENSLIKLFKKIHDKKIKTKILELMLTLSENSKKT